MQLAEDEKSAYERVLRVVYPGLVVPRLVRVETHSWDPADLVQDMAAMAIADDGDSDIEVADLEVDGMGATDSDTDSLGGMDTDSDEPISDIDE